MGLGVARTIRLLHSADRQCRHARHHRQCSGGDKSKKMKLLRICSELCFYRRARAGCWTSGQGVERERNSTATLQPAQHRVGGWILPLASVVTCFVQGREAPAISSWCRGQEGLQREGLCGANTGLQCPGSLVAAGAAAKPRGEIAVQPQQGPGVAKAGDVTFCEQSWCFDRGPTLLHMLPSYYSSEKEQMGHRWEKVT